MDAKATHKELKKEVNILEDRRNADRSFMGWYELKKSKKLKLKAKDKLNETK
jgi:hypothetical protein